MLIGAITPFVMNLAGETQAKAPTVSVDHRITNSTGGTDYDTSTDGDNLVAVTLESGGPLEIDQLYVTASKEIDIGSAEDPGRAYESEESLSDREAFTEGTDGPQIGIGETWQAGETIYLNPEGNATDTDVSIYWTSKSLRAQEAGEVSPGDSYEIASFET
ncbi:hypothetical protein GCM10009021_18350 [Halarchaeum nitratireducens]|uniref:Archaeal Type IV pilin N-terminal domain-containing protein n=1 Tax=Halarchaeum nitratireducens TaxID=489913 RepID=A0A830GCW2_9EURY|nr:hypothetical protein GCM10009021_18350 [Halarchaeum nitratireducens]